MTKNTNNIAFETINRGYNTVFTPNRLSLGLIAPLETYINSPVPTMKDQITRIQLAESLGFSAIWLRDVPFNVPSFGDAGQLFDPFVYLGVLATQTETIALGVASLILPIRHPAHIAKAAASVDVLSKGRLILGIASGDRPDEYPALNIPFEERGKRFRDSVEYIKAMWEDTPSFQNEFGQVNSSFHNPNMDLLPKPLSGKFPMLITGGSQQSPEWAAQQADGWMTYPRNIATQALAIKEWKARVAEAGRAPQPVMQPLYVDLLDDAEAPAKPIHLGIQTGINYLKEYLTTLEDIGINHVALNLRFNQANIETTLKKLADEILPDFTN